MAELYLIVGPSGRRYVGITSLTAAERWATHVKDAQAGRYPRNPLARAIRRHGPETFNMTTLIEGPWLVIQQIEQAAIEAFGSMRPRGYNAREGGTGGRHAEGTRLVMSHAAKKRLATSEAREALRASQLEVWQRLGYRDKMKEIHRQRAPHSAEVEQRRRAAVKATIQSADYRHAQSERMKAWWAARKESNHVN